LEPSNIEFESKDAMFLLRCTVLAYLLTTTQPFETNDRGPNRKPPDDNGVRVHYLRTIPLQEEVRGAGLEEDITAMVKGAQHTITATTTAHSTDLEYANLCDITVFLGLDDLDDALQMLNQGLAINEKVYGKEHLATAACYNNIGAVMKAMGYNVEALEKLNQALATFEKVYGKEHSATATSYTNIGSVMQAMGNNVGALEMYNQGLAIREKVYGKGHPDTAESYNNIGLLMRVMGNNVGALEIFNQGFSMAQQSHI
jgi:tetratricopeptide (TPR) repeat protein